MQPKVIKDPEAFTRFKESLDAAGLPHEDLNMADHLLIGYYEMEDLIGTGGLEIYVEYGLLRSVSITAHNRGKRLGSEIIRHLIEKGKESGLKGIYLLTETARHFFAKIGFTEIDRSEAAEEVKDCAEFAHVCPASAVCMYLDLEMMDKQIDRQR